jgi:bacillithiol biosynthesis deacetylase BshB1
VRENLELPDAEIQSENPEHVRRVVSCIRHHRPDLVVFPTSDDPHPDHSAGGTLIEHALYLSSIYGYGSGGGEERWAVRQALLYPGRREIETEVVVDVTDTFAVKMDAIRAHRSQFRSQRGARETPLNRPGFLEVVEARALVNGHRIGVRYGEPFATLKPIGLRDLSVFE